MAKNPKILESVYSIRDIQIFGAGFRRMKEVDEANRNVNHASFWLTVHRQTIASFPNFFVYLARILILVCAGVLASRGINHPVGTIAISFAATASLSSTFNLTFVVTSLLETYGAAERIFKIEDTMSETEEPANPVSCGEIQTIEFSDVTFSYPGTEKKVLDHFNFKIRKGEKIGIAGASTTGTHAMTAASMFHDITLTIAMTPSDFIWQGFMQGNRDGCKEWPIEGESLFSYGGKPLPYMPFCCGHPQYWHKIDAESKETKSMIASRKLFDESEAAHPITEAEFIKVENICGKLLMIGAEDDVLWDTAKYIRRMEKRLAEKQHTCDVEAAVYEHGTHFVFPEGMLKTMLPIGSGLFVNIAFKNAKKFSKECKETRIDIERRMRNAIASWKAKS